LFEECCIRPVSNVEEEMNTIKQDAVNYTGMAGQAKEDEWECSR
jgi:hypothetical protein